MKIIEGYTSGRKQQGDIGNIRVVKGHDDLLIPAFINAQDRLPAFRHVHDTARWIGQLVSVNSGSGTDLTGQLKGVDFEPTNNLRLTSAIAGRETGGIPGYTTLGRRHGHAESLRYDRLTMTDADGVRSRETMTIEATTVFDRHSLFGRNEAAAYIREYVGNVLEDLGYGDPKTFIERSVPAAEAWHQQPPIHETI